jgi:broad specificity phosphatase PhoE
MSRSDRPLTNYGQHQADSLARYFSARRVDVVIHTGLMRTEATARAIIGNRGIHFDVDREWREADHGDWEGFTYREVNLLYPENVRARFADVMNCAPQGGESLVVMARRVQSAWQRLESQFPNQRIVIVTHGGPIQAMLCHWMSTPLNEYYRWRCDLGSVTAVDCYTATTILRHTNFIVKFVSNKDK